MRAAFALAALAVAGCEKAPADRVEKTEITIDDRGERPQYMLRYEVAGGFEQQIDEVIDLDLHISGAQHADMVMPRMTMTQSFGVDKVDDKGAMHVVMNTDAVRADADGDPRLASGIDAAARGLESLKMSATMFPDGKTRGMHVDMSSVPAGGRDMARQIEEAMDQMVALLPDVSVGKGARWTVEKTERLSNMRVFATYKYEVVDVSADHASLHVDVEMTAPPQQIVTPQGSAHLDAMVGEGSFDMEMDRQKLVDHVTGDLKMGMTMGAAGNVIDLDMVMGLQVLPTGETPAPRKPSDD